MTIPSNELIVGYDYDAWYGYGDKVPIVTDVSIRTNKHILVAGSSGGGKSYYTNQIMAKICVLGGQEQRILFADFKREDSFAYLRNCKNYFSYDKTTDALDIMYEILHKRQSGEDETRTPVYLFWDEYLSNILSIKSQDKKKAESVMMQVAEILSIGRSLNCNICITTQTAYASVFPEGSRSNFGIIAVCGAPMRSIYEMLIPKEYIEKIGERQFKTGEGIVLLQGSNMHCIKVPMVRDEKKMQQICIDALSR